MIKRIATVGGWTLVSRISGFIRDVVMAAVLGAGPMADAFFVAFRLPNHFRAIFAEGAFAAAFVPAYARVLQQAGIDPAKLFADRIAAALIAINLVLLSLAASWAPTISGWRRISSSGWVISAGALARRSRRSDWPAPSITTIHRSRCTAPTRTSSTPSRASRRSCFRSSTCPTIAGTRKGLPIPLRRAVDIFIPNVNSIDMDTTGTWPFGRRLEDQVATRFLSTFLDMSATLNGKKYHVDLLNDPALWNSAPIEPKTPPNPLKNDKEFLPRFPLSGGTVVRCDVRDSGIRPSCGASSRISPQLGDATACAADRSAAGDAICLSPLSKGLARRRSRRD